MEPILLVEDKTDLRAVLRKALEKSGHAVDDVPDGNAAIDRIRRRRYLLVLTDLKLPGASGLDVLREVKQADPSIPVILMTAYGSVEEAVTAMKEGAFDFIQKPVDFDHLRLLVDRAARQQELLRENLILREEYAARYGFPRIVGEHASLKAISQQVQRVAATDSTVLLLGESGTGKELFARAIHDQSTRADGPFITINCAALPEGLVESALFGHEKGAFTGATVRTAGAFERAHGGTLLLDEISEMRLDLQAKLLRVIQEQEFERVGGHQAIKVDVRLVATTNRDIKAEVEAGKFRGDLYYRLAVVPITTPALRERPDDIPRLVQFFLKRSAEQLGMGVPAVPPETMALLQRHAWPGNVRELANAIERGVIMSRGEMLTPDMFAEFLTAPADGPRATPATVPSATPSAPAAVAGAEAMPFDLNEIERIAIDRALQATGGNRTRAAKLLGISERTLRNKLNGPKAPAEQR